MKKILFTLCLAAALTGARGQIYIDSYRFGGAVDDTSVVLLLNFNGANNSTTFTDASTNNFTITRFGAPVISTTQSKFGGASGFFNAQGNLLTVPDNEAFTFGTGNFTIEFWLYTTSTARQFIIWQGNNAGQSLTATFDCEITALGKINPTFFASDGTDFAITSTSSISINTWTHIAIVRDGGTFRLFMDGVDEGTANIAGKTARNSTEAIKIADYTSTGDLEFLGYMDDLRITKGKALYTANFTPPTAELTKITN